MTMGEKEDQPLSLKDLLGNYGALARRGLRYWKRGLAVFSVIFIAGMAVVITRPRTFRSEARFQVQEQERADGNGPGAEEVQRSIDNRLSQVYGSRTNIISLITRLHLYPLLQGKTSETKLAELFWGSLDRAVQTDTVQIGFKYGDPQDAQRVVQGLIDLFVNARRNTAVQRAREALQTVDAQLHQLEGSLAERQESLDEFVLANQAMVEEVRARRGGPTRIQIGSNGAAPARPAESDNRASARTRRLQTRIAQLNASLESMRNPSQGNAATADEPPELTAMRERVRAKQSEVEAIRARGLTPDHPTRAAAERELLGMQALLNSAIARHRGAQQSAQNLSQAEREQRIEQINRDIAAARSELADSQRADSAAPGANQPRGPAPAPGTPNPLTRTNIVAVEAEYDRLTTDVTTTRASYQDLLRRKFDRQGDMRRAELSGGEQIRILDAPSRPIEPEPPGRTKMAMVVSVLAMLLALGTALISGFIDTRIYDTDDLRRWGELAELPFIPDLHFDGSDARSRAVSSPTQPPPG
jgi:uncharacterized protein involved in exopolysaccharide biosynthesis